MFVSKSLCSKPVHLHGGSISSGENDEDEDTTEMVLFFCPHQLYLSSISFSNVSCPANGAHSGPVLVPS